MEALYKMMRDLFSLKPPINQNQFFTQGFTQRKLEMSTTLATHIRKLTYELTNRITKKTVQTQSLMKSSLKRPNSAPKQIRVIELGDDEDDRSKSRGYSAAIDNGNRPKKSKLNSRYNGERGGTAGRGRTRTYPAGGRGGVVTADEADDATEDASSDSERSNPANSYTANYDSGKVVGNNNGCGGGMSEGRGVQECPAVLPAYRRDQLVIEPGNLSAYETAPIDLDGRQQRYGACGRGDSQGQGGHRAYDVKQYTPRLDEDHALLMHGHAHDQQAGTGVDRLVQQLETVLARITLLESRMQRMESRFVSFAFV